MLLSSIWVHQLPVCVSVSQTALSLSLLPDSSSLAFQFVLAPITAVYLIHVIVVIIVQVGRMH